MNGRKSRILVEDPELAERLDEERRPGALRDCVADVIHIPAGAWPAGAQAPHVSYAIGLLVLDGLLTRRVGLDERFGAELLGAGDLLRPWQREDAEAVLPHAGEWRVLSPCRIAVLDGDFAIRLARHPEVTASLFDRAIRRSRQLAMNMAIVHQPRVDIRLHMLFWTFADRWGTVGPDGVRVPLRLTHAVLGELVAAQRQTVSKALGALDERGAVRWTGKDWLLRGDRPVELRAIGSISA
ncbi:MAG: Crp/Fnr family transcriptional regulator [Trebonia sp.]